MLKEDELFLLEFLIGTNRFAFCSISGQKEARPDSPRAEHQPRPRVRPPPPDGRVEADGAQFRSHRNDELQTEKNISRRSNF